MHQFTETHFSPLILIAVILTFKCQYLTSEWSYLLKPVLSFLLSSLSFKFLNLIFGKHLYISLQLNSLYFFFFFLFFTTLVSFGVVVNSKSCFCNFPDFFCTQGVIGDFLTKHDYKLLCLKRWISDNWCTNERWFCSFSAKYSQKCSFCSTSTTWIIEYEFVEEFC